MMGAMWDRGNCFPQARAEYGSDSPYYNFLSIFFGIKFKLWQVSDCILYKGKPETISYTQQILRVTRLSFSDSQMELKNLYYYSNRFMKTWQFSNGVSEVNWKTLFRKSCISCSTSLCVSVEPPLRFMVTKERL